jgi:HPt (histidine-containing phosphotransfer) domain-containing protein
MAAPRPSCAALDRAPKGLTNYYSPSPAIETRGLGVFGNFVNASFRTTRHSPDADAARLAERTRDSLLESPGNFEVRRTAAELEQQAMAKPAIVNLDEYRPDADGAEASSATLDLVHLSRQTLGDHALERELLTLFERQTTQFAARLVERRRPGDRGSRADLAHTLKGSARAVGAVALGDAAEAYEAALRGGSESDAAFCERLLEEIERARAAVAQLL